MTKNELRAFLDTVQPDQEFVAKFEKDCIMNDDGYYVYFPTNQGYLTDLAMLQIVAYLDKKNREWDDGVDEFFHG